MKTLFPLFAGLLLAGSMATATTFYRYAPSGTNSSVQSKHQNVDPNATMKSMFPDLTDDEIWIALFKSEYYIGKPGASYIRAWDLLEDWTVNYRQPGEDNRNRYRPFYANGDSTVVCSDTSYPRILRDGRHSGQSIFNNADLVAFGDDTFVFYSQAGEMAGTLSFYSYATGRQLTAYGGWTNFKAGSGPWGGESLADKMQYLIGFEGSELFFLNGANTIISYDRNGGAGKSFQYNFTGDLADYTLADIIDGKIEGYTYLGWDEGAVIVNLDIEGLGPGRAISIPEPPMALGAFALVLIFFKKRRGK